MANIVNIENKFVESDNVVVNALKEQLKGSAEESKSLKESLSGAQREARNLQRELRELKDEGGFDELNEKAEKFDELIERATKELRSYLSSVGLDSSDWRFEEFFEGIQEGSITAKEAIGSIATSWKGVIEANRQAFGELQKSDAVGTFTETLDRISESLDTVLEKLAVIERDGVKTIGDVGANNSGNAAESFEKIGESILAMSYDAKEASEPIAKIVQSIKEYEAVDSEKILSVTQAFKGVAEIGAAGAESVSGVTELAQKIQTLSETGTGNVISKSFVDSILPSINAIVDKLGDFGNKGSAAVEQITNKMQEMLAVMNEIAKNRINISGITGGSGGKFKTDVTELNLVKEKAVELVNVTQQLYSGFQKIGNVGVGALIKGAFGEDGNKFQLLLDIADEIEKVNNAIPTISSATNISSVNKVITEVTKLKFDLDKLAESARNLGHSEMNVDTSKLEAATKKLEEYKLQSQRFQKDVIAAVTGVGKSGETTSADLSKPIVDATEQEKKALNEVNNIAKEHEPIMAQAAAAERQKAEESKNLTSDLKSEKGAIDNVVSATESHVESLARLTTGLNELDSDGFSMIKSSLMQEGVDESFASKMAESFRDLNGSISSVETTWRSFGDAGSHVSKVTVKAVDDVGKSIQRTVGYTYQLKDGIVQMAVSDGGKSKIDYAAIDAANKRADAEYQKQANIELARMAEEEAARASAEAAAKEKINQEILSDVYQKTGKDAEEAADAMRMAWSVAERESRETERASRESSQALKEKYDAERNYTTALTQGEAALRDYSAAENSRNEASRKAYGNIKAATDELRRAKAAYDGTPESVKNLQEATRKYNLTLNESKRVLAETGDNVRSFGDKLKNAVSQFSMWFSMSRVIMSVYREIRKMISTSIELDQTMTQLRIVTKASNDEMQRFGETAAASAKKVGASITDLTSSATTFARLGYSLSESSTLAEYTTMLQNVGNIDVTDAQNAITAIVKAYKDEIDIDNIEDVMNRLVVVGKMVAQQRSNTLKEIGYIGQRRIGFIVETEERLSV